MPDAEADFAFLVHPLRRWQRPLLGVRLLHLPLFLGHDAGIDGVGAVARVDVETAAGWCRGLVVSVPDTAERLAAEQGRALAHQERAAQVAMGVGVRAIGLGNALAVVAGRGKALAERTATPVTTGNASTAWACATITKQVLADRGAPRGPVGLLGFRGTVGEAVAATLAADGVEVFVDVAGRAARTAEQLGCVPVSLDDLLRRPSVFVGASTTGPVIPAARLPTGAILVDLALPPTLEPGPRPSGLRVVAGERLRLPGAVRRDVWGAIWLALARYGRGCVFACFAEPIAIALGGVVPSGRHLSVDDVAAAGAQLSRLGFRPVVTD